LTSIHYQLITRHATASKHNMNINIVINIHTVININKGKVYQKKTTQKLINVR